MSFCTASAIVLSTFAVERLFQRPDFLLKLKINVLREVLFQLRPDRNQPDNSLADVFDFRPCCS